ncbi:MAG: hypothetical protein ABI947_02290 [Chloroflexota bacterium]
MRDVFYFARDEIKLEDIKQLAEDLGYKAYLAPNAQANPNIRSLVVHYSEADYWRCLEITEDDFLEEAEKAKLRSMGPHTGFQIKYMGISMPDLRTFLKFVLERHGGWVGCNDEWERVYLLENIELLQCFGDEKPSSKLAT